MNTETLALLNAAFESCSCENDHSLEEVIEYYLELEEKIEDCESDFNLCMSFGDVRIISKGSIDQIWTDSLIEQVKDCYDLSELPSFVKIDWEATAEECKVDGMGHHFNHYDGEELETSNYHIFRTN
jgi:hypothetical protein